MERASGWQGALYFRRYGRELVSKPAILLQKRWRGYRRTTRGPLSSCLKRTPTTKAHHLTTDIKFLTLEFPATAILLTSLFFFTRLFYYLRSFPFSFSLPRRSSDPGSLNRLFSPLPTTEHAFLFIATGFELFLPSLARIQLRPEI